MGLPPLRHEPPPNSLGPPRNDGATRPGRREPIDREIASALRKQRDRAPWARTAEGRLALAPRMQSLHFASGSLQWVVTAYVLASGGLVLLGGHAADLARRRRIFLAVFGLAAGPGDDG